MYESFFQLQSRPFPAAPVVANYFPSQSMDTARQNLIRAVERAEGPGVVIGPAGIGKTLLLRVVGDHFASALRVVMLSGTRIVTRKSLLQSILFELQLPYRGMDEGELRLSLLDALRRSDNVPNGILLLIDEAHVLPLRLLDEARLITNVVHDGRPRVSLILAGGPQLEDRFTHPKLDSFNQRIAARCYLQPFTRDETHEYIRAEISWAGGDADSIFSGDAARAVFRASDGIPRIINQVCDHAMVMAGLAGRHHINSELIQESWSDLQQLPPPWQEPKLPAATASSGAVIEFGQLADDSEAGDASVATFGVGEEESTLARDLDAPMDDFVSAGAFGSDVMLVNAPFLTEMPEWTNCQDLGELSVSEPTHGPSTLDPFADSFDEEIVVIDRSTAQTTDGFRGRPRVSCAEAREIIEALGLLPKEPSGVAKPITESIVDHPVRNVPDSAFEFSTLQDLPAIDTLEEFNSFESPVHHETEEQIELEFDDEVDCVPLPWTRGSLGDDRDIIIVEEESPVASAPEVDGDSANKPRTEYRELFAQLRRVSN